MPRIAATESLDTIIRDAVGSIVASASQAIARSLATMVAEQLESELMVSSSQKVVRARTRRARRSAPARAEITRWVADRRARRVPKFVIEATGLDLKKDLVEKYGADAVFEKGKSLPKAT